MQVNVFFVQVGLDRAGGHGLADMYVQLSRITR